MKIAWMIHQGEEINWSSALRLRRLDIAGHLGSMAWPVLQAEVIRGYQDGSKGSTREMADRLADFDAVVFAEQSTYDFELMGLLRALGQNRPALIRDHCEDIWGFPWEMECFGRSDMVVCSSAALARRADQEGLPSTVIHEHYESAPAQAGHDRLLAGYMGTDGHLAASLREIGNSCGWNVEILCRPEDGIAGSITWTESGWRERFSRYRVLLCPQRPQLTAKSPAKVVQAMGNGMPVLASSTVESYRELVTHGEDGLLVDGDRSSWARAFRVAASSAVHSMWHRNLLRHPVRASHSLDSISRQWLTLFCKLAAGERR